MNHSITTWMLAGALVASLAWNAKSLYAARSAAVVPSCSEVPDLSALDLSAEQTRALETWRANSCAPSCSMDGEAEAKLAELRSLLRDPSATPERLHELGAEVSRLRAHALEACVDSIVAVRRVLTREQLASLMQCCRVTTDCER